MKIAKACSALTALALIAAAAWFLIDTQRKYSR